MPRLSDTMEEGVVAKWLVKIGDKVSEGDILAEIETDKATMEFESFHEGTLLHIGINEGETAAVDTLLAIIGEDGEDISQLINPSSSSLQLDLVDQINQVKNNPLVQKLLTYAFIWTCCSTALYFFSLEIINKYTNDIVEQRAIFADADSLVTPITFFTQILITRFLLESRFFGLKFVLGIYGVLFMIAYLMMAGHFAEFLFTGTGVLLFLIISALMRPFEYAINKPARETVYTTLKKSEKYRSTVFIDTFINRFGDASGGLLFNILLTLGLTLAVAPLAILPLALVLSGFGVNISKIVKDVIKKDK